ncbi:MAG: ABC transporter ATP-binding protein [bacterium]
MSFLIEAKHLWREYGSNIVLENISIGVKEGEFITIVGASGCGKTTFLRMLLGVDQPTRGVLLLDGEPIPDEPGPDRGIVFQRYSVFPHMDVLQNVMAGLEFQQSPLFGSLFGSRKQSAKQLAMEILDAVGLSHALRKYPFELSGGMQQRLAIAQSLIKKPRILLLDEPFGALDPGIRKDMHELTLNLWHETGITIFMITHDLVEGFYLGTRLWVFDKPRVDPHDPNRFGAQITFDIPVGQCGDQLLGDIVSNLNVQPAALTEVNEAANHV